MRFKLLTMFAAAMLLAACESTTQDTSGADGSGNTTTTQTNQNTGPMVGTAEDFYSMIGGDRVFFDFDKSDLRPDARATLDAAASYLSTHQTMTLTLEGHCDERGTREYNLALGERRANAMRDYLVALGVSHNRLATISYGKERPAVVGSGDAVWAQNRRGVLVVN